MSARKKKGGAVWLDCAMEPFHNPTQNIYLAKTPDGDVVGRLVYFMSAHFHYPSKFHWAADVDGVSKYFESMEAALSSLRYRLRASKGYELSCSDAGKDALANDEHMMRQRNLRGDI